jgi:pimeloyl-ACP methyl ester carboxylesterase
VILITGSGPQTRDQSVAGHPSFLVLADYLTRNGVAVFRYDDRGTGKSTGRFASAVSSDFAADAIAAFEWLRKQPEVSPGRCGIFGHSEGGVVGPMAAKGRTDIAFMVLLAPPAVRGSDLLLAQKEAILRTMGNDAPDLSADRAFYEALLAGKPDEELRSLGARFVPEDRVESLLLSPWMRSFLAYDPAPGLEALNCPTLLLFGEKDLQVLPSQNEPVVRALAKRNPRLTVEVLPGLNHLGQTATTGSPAEYNQIEETMSPLLMKRILRYVSEAAVKPAPEQQVSPARAQ